MPYVCKFCKGKHCAAHRLPENHGCAGLDVYREKMRQEGRVFAPDVNAPMQARVSRTARAGASMDAVWSRLEGKMTYVFMALCVAVFILQLVYEPLTDWIAVDENFVSRPWTVVTSIFAHGSLNHLFVNTLVLLFFGQAVERLIGTRRFTWLFLAAGAAAGVAQIVITQIIFQDALPTLGASGAIQGISGVLVVLAPRLTVLVFFIIPAPLWALVIFYVLFDVVGALSPGSPVANFAHLAGLAIGLAYGYYLRKSGLRAVTQPPPPPQARRMF